MGLSHSRDTLTFKPAPQELMPAIEMNDLCKAFGTFQAIDHLTLRVWQGEIFGLLGPNGSGKTTTINMLLITAEESKV